MGGFGNFFKRSFSSIGNVVTNATSKCTPIIKKNNVYIRQPPPKCTDPSYNITTLDQFNRMNIGNIDLDFLYSCILQNKPSPEIITDVSATDIKISNYNSQKGLLDTYNEMNNTSMYYYKNDLIYVICKISFFIILLITYIYFFKLTGIIEPIKKLFATLITKGDTIINKISDKVKKPNPNPNPNPTNSNSSKPTNSNSNSSKPTNPNPNPKPINANPKPINANPKPNPNINIKPKISTNTKVKPTNSK
jgi:hypothetical protein